MNIEGEKGIPIVSQITSKHESSRTNPIAAGDMYVHTRTIMQICSMIHVETSIL